MFAFLRKLIVPIMVTVLVFFLATIVFDWGMKASSSRQVKDSVGYINGENITTRMFDSYYQNILRKEEEKVDYDLPPDKIEEIKKEAWNQLMIDFLINQEINKHKIYVSDEEIYEFLKLYPPSELRTTPQFMTDGKFDYQKYVKAMVNPEMASYWTAVENFIIPELKKYKLQEEIISTVRVSPAEVQDAFLADRESVKIGYLYFPATRFMTNLPQITQDELKKYYDSHRDEYKRPKRATFDMVLFEKAPTENDWEKIGYRIKEIYDSAVGGSDFAELARAYSEDNSASQGGDLGWFGRKQMVPEFDSVVWLLKANEVSKPFRSRFGWHIVKLLNKKSEKETSMTGANPLEIEKVNAAHILLKVTPSQETMDQIELNAKDFATQASELGFEKAAKDLKYEIRSTTPFAENDYIQYLGANQGASDFAFRNKPGKVSDMMENNSTYFVLKVRAHLPEGYASFEEVNEVVSQEVTAEKAKEASLDTAQIAHSAIKTGVSLQSAGGRYGFPYAETEMITINSAIPNIGHSPEIIGTAFALKNIGDISHPIEYVNGSAIIKLLAKVPANLEEFKKIQDSLQIAVLQKKQQDTYNRWFDNLIKNSKIENDVDRYYSGGY